MIISVGEILYDIFPDQRRLGGAPFNFALHLKRLGYPVRFISRVGRDDTGRAILEHLEREGFSIDDIGIDSEHETGWVQVSIDENGTPSFRIMPDVAYDFISADDHRVAIVESSPKLFYFGSLIQRTEAGFQNLHKILDGLHKNCRFFYDMNLRDGCRKRAIIETSLTRADILKLSGEELGDSARLLGVTGHGHGLVETIMGKFNISVMAVTRGAAGSHLYMNGRLFTGRPETNFQVVDTVGAGDAYAAILAAGIMDGLAPETIIADATRFSARICTIGGAIPQSNGFYDEFQKERQ